MRQARTAAVRCPARGPPPRTAPYRPALREAYRRARAPAPILDGDQTNERATDEDDRTHRRNELGIVGRILPADQSPFE
ncbi:hypothetical protein CA831_20825, partial [Burkholderia multivorans]